MLALIKWRREKNRGNTNPRRYADLQQDKQRMRQTARLSRYITKL
jgi:hypothetical protein